jgi:hypothetical protein
MNAIKEDILKIDPMKYSGIDNLEVMREARNYNKFLLDLIF